MTTTNPQAPGNLDRLDPDKGAFVAIAGLAMLLVGVMAFSASYHRGVISSLVDQTIANPEALAWASHPAAQLEGQIQWPLSAHAALLCGKDELGAPQAVVAKVHKGQIQDELWMLGFMERPEARAFCTEALQRKAARA